MSVPGQVNDLAAMQAAIDDLLEFDPVGVSGGIANAPSYQNTVVNSLNAISKYPPPYWANSQTYTAAQAAQANMNYAAQNNFPTPPLTWHILPNVYHAKLKLQGERLALMLPMCIASRVTTLEFQLESDTHCSRFVVTFINRHLVVFDNVDDFPTPQDIARIALECP